MTVSPPRWTDAEFEADRRASIERFRRARVEEPLARYLDGVDSARRQVEDLFARTATLGDLRHRAPEVLADPALLTTARYLAGPPISADDLRTLADDASLSPSRLRRDPEMAARVVDVLLLGLDRGRFPWFAARRRPKPSEREAAVVATAVLLAQRSVITTRANDAKAAQEEAVMARLVEAGMTRVARRAVPNLQEAPPVGTFCAESQFGSRKADVVVRLYDGRVMPLEAKVSNSSTNSIKRLNNDAAAKARQWTQEFGTSNVVPAAVLDGVFKLRNLRTAQDNDDLTIFWAHRLDALVEFVAATAGPQPRLAMGWA